MAHHPRSSEDLVPETGFRRILIRLHHAGFSVQSLDIAAGIAEQLHLEMHGIFVEDSRVLQAACLPGIREFQLPGDGWRTINADEVRRATERAAVRAEVLLRRAASSRVTCRFERRPTLAEEASCGPVRGSDILLIAAPTNPFDRASGPYAEPELAEDDETTALLIVPRQVARTHGAIAAVGGAGETIVLEIARRIAVAAGERLVSLDPFDAGTPSRATFPLSAGERLIVAARTGGAMPTMAPWIGIASARRVPVLLIPERAEGPHRQER